MSNVPEEIVIVPALTFVETVPVAPLSRATSNNSAVVVAPQLVPNSALLVEPTNLIVVEPEIMLAFGVVVLEFKVPFTSSVKAPVRRVAAL
jgi:hypothetical protein